MRADLKTRLYGGKGMAFLLLAPALTLFLLFQAWPCLDAFWVSLCSWTGFSPEARFVGAENYVNLAHDERFLRSVWNTVVFVFLGGVGHFLFAFLFAFALSHPRFKGKKFFQTMIFFPAFISVAGVGILWACLYESKEGLLNQLLNAVGFDSVTWLDTKNTLALGAIVIASVWAGVGSQMIVLLAGIKRIPPTYYEAARIDGASEWQTFRMITLPLLKDVIYVALALWLVGGLQVFGLVQALAGPTIPLEFETVSTYQYAISFNARDNIYMMGRGTAMALVLAGIIVMVVGGLRLFFGKREVEY